MALVYVRATTSGATFNPTIELVSGATGSARWVCEETSEELTGNSPTFNWGTAATRHVRLYVEVTPGGTDVLGEVTTWNTGFRNWDDAGRYGPGASYNKEPEAITAIENVNLMTGIVRFLSANTTLGGALDFTGCASLQFIECFYADVASVTLAGCSSLIRICLEACALTNLDLNPVAATLRDCRAAIQSTGTLTFATMTSPLAVLYHFCVRAEAAGYTVVNIPPASMMPAVEELWIWRTGQSGTLVTGAAATSIHAYGNAYTSANLSASTNAASIMLYDCDFNTPAIDNILATVNGFNTTEPPTREINLTAQAGPSANGVVDANAMIARGWSVAMESESSAGVHFDTFNRPNGVPSNGWHGILGGQGNNASGTIVSNQLQRLDNVAYQLYGNPGGGDLPADYTVYAVVPHATTTTFFGLFGRWAGGNGVRLLFTDSRTNITVGEAWDWGQNNITLTTDAALPASWAVDQPHTIAMRMTGTLIQIYVDGVLVRHGTMALNATSTGTEYGICGEGASRYWDEIGTTLDRIDAAGAGVSLDVAGDLSGGGVSTGGVASNLAIVGALSGAGVLGGSSTVGVTCSGELSSSDGFAGGAVLAIDPSGALSGVANLSGGCGIGFTVAGALSALNVMDGVASIGVGITSGILTSADEPEGAIYGGVTVGVACSGELSGVAGIVGGAWITVACPSELSGVVNLVGSASILVSARASASRGGGPFGWQLVSLSRMPEVGERFSVQLAGLVDRDSSPIDTEAHLHVFEDGVEVRRLTRAAGEISYAAATLGAPNLYAVELSFDRAVADVGLVWHFPELSLRAPRIALIVDGPRLTE